MDLETVKWAEAIRAMTKQGSAWRRRRTARLLRARGAYISPELADFFMTRLADLIERDEAAAADRMSRDVD
jgi:hypothetical protein